MNDQRRVEQFLREFSSRLTKGFPGKIDFILLFGSAARGEWKRGVSDVDLIIQLKRNEDIEKIAKKAEELFWELDEKYDTRFREVCSIGKTAEEDPLRRILSKTRLYVPFEVLGPDDIDWKKGEIRKKELALGAKLIASQAMLFKKMKYEGRILFGRDIRRVIQIKISWWEKIKALLIPFYISFFSTFLALFLPQKAIKLANKAAIYSIESTLFFLEKPIGRGIRKATRTLERELKNKARRQYNFLGIVQLDFMINFDYRKLVNFNFANEAIKLKYNWDREIKRFGRWQALKFCWQSVFFVNSMNWYAILKTDKYKIIFKLLIIVRIILILLFITFVFIYF